MAGMISSAAALRLKTAGFVTPKHVSLERFHFEEIALLMVSDRMEDDDCGKR